MNDQFLEKSLMKLLDLPLVFVKQNKKSVFILLNRSDSNYKRAKAILTHVQEPEIELLKPNKFKEFENFTNVIKFYNNNRSLIQR